MIIVLIVFIIFALVGIFLANIIDDKELRIFFSFLSGMLSVTCVLVLIEIIEESDYKPTPIDVYRGKTTLQITYVDSVATDTVVVFKPEFRK